MKITLLFLIFCLISFGESANILGIFNHPGHSHTYLGKILLKTLAQNGHNIVMISSFPLKEKIPNYQDIYLNKNLEDLKQRNKRKHEKVIDLKELRNMTLQHTEDTFLNQEVKKLIESNATFDIIIIDWFFNEGTLIFGHIFKAPVVYLSSFGNMALLTQLTGNVLPYSYVPGAAQFMTDELTFGQRCFMTLFNVANLLYSSKRHDAHYELIKRHFDNPPTIEELQENVALVLSNSHFSFETARPYTPNIIPIGGFHIEEPEKLPKDLQEFLDSATEGAILFSLGSQLKSSDLTDGALNNIIKALGQVKQKVLWKVDASLTQLPKNIKMTKWVPQIEALVHPNLKLFITHGGALSLIEAIHFQVPLLCIPFKGDQITNAAFIESRGLGLHLPPNNITENNFHEAVVSIIENPKYQENIHFHSSLLREQPIKPRDLAVYWVEHILKHKKWSHLKTFATKLPWYKYFLVDVIAFFLGTTILSIMFITYFVLFIKQKICTFFKWGKRKTE